MAKKLSPETVSLRAPWNGWMDGIILNVAMVRPFILFLFFDIAFLPGRARVAGYGFFFFFFLRFFPSMFCEHRVW